jgi:hypothetical protein
VGSGNLLTARRSERIHVRMPVTLCGDSKGQSNEHTVFAVDLSNNGVRVCAKAGLVPGQAVAIVMNSGQQVTLPGRVVWIGPVGTRLEGQAGIEFLKPITPPV